MEKEIQIEDKIKTVLDESNKKFTLKNDNEQKVVDRWTDIGLLYGIENEDLKKTIAFAYEYAAIYILLSASIGEEVFNGDVETLSFPIIRRILGDSENAEYLKNGNPNLSFNKPKLWLFSVGVINEVHYELKNFDIKSINCDPQVDMDGEFCLAFTESFKLKNKLETYFK
jgi:hypothetical protein